MDNAGNYPDTCINLSLFWLELQDTSDLGDSQNVQEQFYVLLYMPRDRLLTSSVRFLRKSIEYPLIVFCSQCGSMTKRTLEQMMQDFCLEHPIGFDILVKIGEALGVVGVNIEGLSMTSFKNQGVIHFVVKDIATAKSALEKADLKIKAITDVFVLDKDQKRVTGKSGSFGEICKTLSDNGIQVYFGYPAENNRFIFGVSNVKKAQELFRS
jgi:hypothetical protein